MTDAIALSLHNKYTSDAASCRHFAEQWFENYFARWILNGVLYPNTPEWCCIVDRLNTVFFYAPSAIDDTVNGETMLHLASKHGNMEMVAYLLAHGANIDVRDANGKTPEQVACTHINVGLAFMKQAVSALEPETFEEFRGCQGFTFASCQDPAFKNYDVICKLFAMKWIYS